MKFRKVDVSIERKIIHGMLFSKTILDELLPIVNLNFFKDKNTQKVVKWILEYNDEYSCPPNIAELFEHKCNHIKYEEREAIEPIIQDIINRPSVTNNEYVLDQSIEYFKKRQLEIITSNIQYHLDKGDCKKAEDEVIKFSKVSKLTTTWENPFDKDKVSEVFTDIEDDFFSFPGPLGKYLGKFKRGWLVGILGPFKKGKTWYQQEFGLQALLLRLKVAIISLEMTPMQMRDRVYKRLTAYTKEAHHIFPVFDCEENQKGTCRKRERTNSIRLINSNGMVPEFRPNMQYKICDACRNTRDFVPSVWYESQNNPLYEYSEVSRYAESFNKLFGDNLRLKSYPRFSASLNDVERDLDILEQRENFIPDVLILDYADILRSDTKEVGIDKEDLVWMNLARIASERHMLLVTGTQGTRQSINAGTVTAQHLSKWIGKLGHLDCMLALSQNNVEKLQGIMRIGMISHRHMDFNEGQTCMVLQSISAGQPYLDAYIS